jgi:hypothetical protein
LKGLFQLLLSPYILTSSSILRRGFRSRQTDRLSSRHLAPQALMLMPMIMSGTVMATATLAAMISLRIMSSSVCDGAQTVMEGVRPFMWGQGSQNASACFPWPLADHLPDHFSPGSKHSTRCRNLFLGVLLQFHPVTRPATLLTGRDAGPARAALWCWNPLPGRLQETPGRKTRRGPRE